MQLRASNLTETEIIFQKWQKTSLLESEILTIADLMCDMMKYPHRKDDKFRQLYQILEDYYKDEY